MTKWRARVRLLIFACVTGLALSGCGGADGSDGGPADGGADSGSEEEFESPLSEYGLGSGGKGFAGRGMAVSARAETSEEDEQKMREVEDLVATCMQERGFEYVPVVYDPEDFKDPFADAYALDPADFAEQYGYGISTMSFIKPEENTDPNQEIREGLSPAAQEEYDKALFGDVAVLTTEGGSGWASVTKPAPADQGEPVDEDDKGCHQVASEEIYGEPEDVQRPDMSEFDGMFEDLGTLYERIETDPRITEAAAAWASCMAEAGYADFEKPMDASTSVMDRMGELYQWDNPGHGAAGGGVAEPPADAEGEVTADFVSPADVDPAELEGLKEYELAVAVADYGCQQESYEEVYVEVSTELEEEFVDSHRDELERYRDAMGEGPVGFAGGLG